MLLLQDRFEVQLHKSDIDVKDVHTFQVYKTQEPISDQDLVFVKKMLDSFPSRPNVVIEIVEKMKNYHIDFMYHDPICPLSFTYWLTPVPMDSNELFRAKTSSDIQQLRREVQSFSTNPQIVSLLKKPFVQEKVLVIPSCTKDSIGRRLISVLKDKPTECITTLTFPSNMSLSFFHSLMEQMATHPTLFCNVRKISISITEHSSANADSKIFLHALELLLVHFKSLEFLNLSISGWNNSNDLLTKCLCLFCEKSCYISPELHDVRMCIKSTCIYMDQSCLTSTHGSIDVGQLCHSLECHRTVFYPLDTLMLRLNNSNDMMRLSSIFKNNSTKFPYLEVLSLDFSGMDCTPFLREFRSVLMDETPLLPVLRKVNIIGISPESEECFELVAEINVVVATRS